MKISALTFSFLLGLAFTGISYANCEASIIGGSHSSSSLEEAKAGAAEDAKEACYPGQAKMLDSDCSSEGADTGSAATFNCKQTVTCTLCGDDLKRKYEAMN